MFIKHKNLTIRNATAQDATLLCNWWNDGKVMAHAGFPNGVGTDVPTIISQISTDDDNVTRRLIIEVDNVPVGEMNYRNKGNDTAEIGIKICDFSKQEKGHGKLFLSMMINSLFTSYGYKKIILDTNVANTRASHVYENLGFIKVRTNINSWQNQLGEMQSSIDYELCEDTFNNFAEV